ncbi:MAG: aspartate carbamoyltransferase [Acidimicrobiia bacterium]
MSRHAPIAGGDRRWAVAAAGVAVAALLVAACGDGGGDDADRQDAVAARGAEVMPFDLDATTHRFAPVDDGLIQTVVADDPGDAEQVGLIREHLTHEADRFTEGDFGDPATIHGHDMPGLAELEAGAGGIRIAYDEIEGGARIAYTTTDPALVSALHRWGEAQVTDHGAHAEHG